MQAAPYGPAYAPTLTQDDESHLKTLSILHYVYGGLMLLAGSFFLIYVVIGIVMLATTSSAPDPTAMIAGGVIFLVIGALLSGVAAAKGALTIYAGVCLAAKRRPMLCMIAAGLSCMNFPLGTALGVFTFVVISRPAVKQAFARPS
jgi:hypothetical protein